MYHYDHQKLNSILTEVFNEALPPDTYAWLIQAASTAQNAASFGLNFGLVPRKIGRGRMDFGPATQKAIEETRKGFNPGGWTRDRTARVWLLMQLDPTGSDKYLSLIDNLFRTAEVNEQVALYSALPLLAYPEKLILRCAEGIRSNIGDVLEAIMYDNPYPAENLPEPAWNQMVMKAFFTEKSVYRIIGIDERANEKLAHTLSDYAHERWAAHRNVNPLIWRCISPFLNEKLFSDIRKIAASDDPLERKAAALVCYHSTYAPARELLDATLKTELDTNDPGWNGLADKMKEHVL